MSIRVPTLAIPPFSNHLCTPPSRTCNQNSDDPSPEAGEEQKPDEVWSRCIAVCCISGQCGRDGTVYGQPGPSDCCSEWLTTLGADAECLVAGQAAGLRARRPLDGNPPVTAAAAWWRCRNCENVPAYCSTSVFFRTLFIEEAGRLLH